MKKLLSLMMMFAFFTSVSMAQVPAKRTTSTAPASTMQTPKSSGAMMKKDGTPDKRFKANQAAKQMVAGPVKKDGTPDKRYKTNKTVAPKK